MASVARQSDSKPVQSLSSASQQSDKADDRRDSQADKDTVRQVIVISAHIACEKAQDAVDIGQQRKPQGGDQLPS